MAWSYSNYCSGRGGGGGAAMVWAREETVQTATFTAGSLVLTLASTPDYDESVLVFYNGQKLRSGTDYTISGTDVTIEFGDTPADYDTGNVIFEIHYTHA